VKGSVELMLIVGLNGSPQKEGNTWFLLKEALKAAEELGAKTEILHVTGATDELKIPFCNNCTNPCQGVCYKNEKIGELLETLKKADGIIMGSPVYFGSVTGQLKSFWDKTRHLRKDKFFLNTVGGAVAVGGSRFGGQETTIKAIHDMMLVQGMLLVGDGYKDDDAGHQGVCAQKPAENDSFAIKRAQIMGKRVAEVAKATVEIRKFKL